MRLLIRVRQMLDLDLVQLEFIWIHLTAKGYNIIKKLKGMKYLIKSTAVERASILGKGDHIRIALNNEAWEIGEYCLHV